MTAALLLEDLAVHYGGQAAVREVTLTVDPGQWVAVIGPNGAGKSTVLRAIVGVAAFTGRLELAGGVVEARAGVIRRALGRDRAGGRGAARRVAYVPQQPVLPEGMTVAEYVLLGRTAHLGLLRSESAADRQRVARVLDDLDLGDQAARPMTELSGGEGQRATLARALVQEASILILDEPTSALDLGHQVGVLELIDRLRRERDLAVVTALHDLTVASRFADHLLLLADGAPVASGPPGRWPPSRPARGSPTARRGPVPPWRARLRRRSTDEAGRRGPDRPGSRRGVAPCGPAPPASSARPPRSP